VASIGVARASAIAAAAASGESADGVSGKAMAGIVAGVVINDSGPPSAKNSQMADASDDAWGVEPGRVADGPPGGSPPT
jgi:hypothetical protein